MIRTAANLVALLVMLGILAPQGAGLLAATGLADGRVMVICTGDGLRTLRIDDDGKPVEISESADFCALVHAADIAAAIVPLPVPDRVAFAPLPPLPHPGPVTRLSHLSAQPRAPPSV